MPKPNKGESEADFVARYMKDHQAMMDFPDEKQRLAVAYSEYKKHHKSIDVSFAKDFVVKMPITRFWEQDVDIQKGGAVEKSKQRFMEAVVSGLKEDRDGEMMSQVAIDDMISQFKSGTIPFFPDHGFHEASGRDHIYSWKQMMGVWIDAKQEGEQLKAIARLNRAHPDHETFWKYVAEEGMPVGLSIGGRPAQMPEIVEMDIDIEMNKETK